MTAFAVAYDLIAEKDGHDYEPLWAELRRLGAHRAQYSLWLVNVDNTAQELVKHLQIFVDSNDAVWASRVRRGDYWCVNSRSGTNAWIAENVT